MYIWYYIKLAMSQAFISFQQHLTLATSKMIQAFLLVQNSHAMPEVNYVGNR